MIRSRQNGTQLAKNADISYVYLLDIEKGARSVPRKKVLIALADNLMFRDGEKEVFFDLASKEKEEVPADISEYIYQNYELIDIIRKIKNKSPTGESWNLLSQYIQSSLDEEKI